MNARTRLASLYEEWRLMSESEGDAIRSAAWQRIEHCQCVKSELQQQILGAMENAGSTPANAEEIRHHFQPVLEHLINLELRNNQWLEIERTRLESERDVMGRNQHNLRRLQQAYGSPAAA